MRRTLQPAGAINRGICRNINPSVGEIKKPRSVADQCFRGGNIPDRSDEHMYERRQPLHHRTQRQ